MNKLINLGLLALLGSYLINHGWGWRKSMKLFKGIQIDSLSTDQQPPVHDLLLNLNSSSIITNHNTTVHNNTNITLLTSEVPLQFSMNEQPDLSQKFIMDNFINNLFHPSQSGSSGVLSLSPTMNLLIMNSIKTIIRNYFFCSSFSVHFSDFVNNSLLFSLVYLILRNNIKNGKVIAMVMMLGAHKVHKQTNYIWWVLLLVITAAMNLRYLILQTYRRSILIVLATATLSVYYLLTMGQQYLYLIKNEAYKCGVSNNIVLLIESIIYIILAASGISVHQFVFNSRPNPSSLKLHKSNNHHSQYSNHHNQTKTNQQPTKNHNSNQNNKNKNKNKKNVKPNSKNAKQNDKQSIQQVDNQKSKEVIDEDELEVYPPSVYCHSYLLVSSNIALLQSQQHLLLNSTPNFAELSAVFSTRLLFNFSIQSVSLCLIYLFWNRGYNKYHQIIIRVFVYILGSTVPFLYTPDFYHRS